MFHIHRIDAIHHVEGPITVRDQNHTALLQKVRELCAGMVHHNVPWTICVLERALQRQVAQIREQMEVGGLTADQYDQLVHRKSVRAICRRGGLQTLRWDRWSDHDHFLMDQDQTFGDLFNRNEIDHNIALTTKIGRRYLVSKIHHILISTFHSSDQFSKYFDTTC